MEMAKKFIKSQIKYFALAFLQQFSVPIIIVLLIISLCAFFTDVLDFGKDNKDELDLKKELAYYTDSSYEDEEMKSFIESAWEFVAGLFGVGDLEWPLADYYRISSNYRTKSSPCYSEN